MTFSYLAIFGSGLLTFVSPCVLPLVPILVAALISGDDGSRRARLKATVLFAAGFTGAFVLLGLSLPAVTALFARAATGIFFAAGVLLMLFGLKMSGFISSRKRAFWWMNRSYSLPDLSRWTPPALRAPLLGVVFGLGWTPCVGPILGGVLTYAASTAASKREGALMLFTFAMGIALPLVLVAAFLDQMKPALTRLKAQLPRLERATGFALFVFGAYLIVNSPTLRFASDIRGNPVTAFSDRGETLALGRPEPAAQMVYFYSDDCPICRRMERFLPQFEAACVNERFRFHRVSVDGERNYRAMARFNVRAVPTIAVLDSQGKEVLHLVGFQPLARLREAARAINELECKGVADGEQDRTDEGGTCAPSTTDC